VWANGGVARPERSEGRGYCLTTPVTAFRACHPCHPAADCNAIDAAPHFLDLATRRGVLYGLVYPNFSEQAEYTFTAPPGPHVGGGVARPERSDGRDVTQSSR
jgi:hypothetical protein